MLAVNLLRQCTECSPLSSFGVRTLYTCQVLERARRGTRMRKEAEKKARKKVILALQQKKANMPKPITASRPSPRKDDSSLGYPVDDVYPVSNYKWSRYTVEEAIGLLVEMQHPTQYNNMHAQVIANVELSLAANKKNHFIKEFTNVLLYPHYFKVPHVRTTLAICTDENMIEEMTNSGITFAIELKHVLKMIKKGELELKNYHHVIAHSTLLPEMITMRAYFGKLFPSPREGTAGHDLLAVAKRFVEGVEYGVAKDKYDLDFGKVEAQIGTIDMAPLQFEDNLKALLEDIEKCRPKTRSNDLITLVKLGCPGFEEQLVLDHTKYGPQPDAEEDDAEDLQEQVEAEVET